MFKEMTQYKLILKKIKKLKTKDLMNQGLIDRKIVIGSEK